MKAVLRTQLAVGDAVQFADANGSVGLIEATRGYDDGFYVRWYYGLDARGEAWTALSSVARKDLIRINPTWLDRYRACHAFSEEQKAVSTKDKYTL